VSSPDINNKDSVHAESLSNAHSKQLYGSPTTWDRVLAGVTVSSLSAVASVAINLLFKRAKGKFSFKDLKAKELINDFQLGVSVGAGIIAADAIPDSYHHKQIEDQAIRSGYGLMFENRALRKALQESKTGGHAAKIKDEKEADASILVSGPSIIK